MSLDERGPGLSLRGGMVNIAMFLRVHLNQQNSHKNRSLKICVVHSGNMPSAGTIIVFCFGHISAARGNLVILTIYTFSLPLVQKYGWLMRLGLGDHE